MFATTTTGYSVTAPTEVGVISKGHKRPSSSKRPLIISTGYGSNADACLYTDKISLRPWTSAGYVAFQGDFGGTNTWGNDTAQSRIDEGWTYIKAQLPCATDKVLLLGQSMGGVDVLNWANNHLSSVAAIALCHPAIDIADIHDNNRAFAPHPGGFATDIETAYTNLAGYQAAEPTHNPKRVAANFSSIPVFIQYSADDPICIASIATTFATNAGATAYNAGNGSHGFGSMTTNEIFNFLGRYV